MKARKILEGASFDPDQLKVVYKAFDAAWEQIAPKLSNRPNAVEAARAKLATTVINLAKAETRNSDELTADAIKAMFDNPTNFSGS